MRAAAEVVVLLVGMTACVLVGGWALATSEKERAELADALAALAQSVRRSLIR